ncbi:flagellar basal body rod protein FlgC [Sphingomonas hankookensis]|uniref:flagellar basal body rod protein FlgC n=1 Tax=Sphingomonas hankookensis TaxID=563996 RepID=UPI001F5894DA|nr:flagellar basal body rod C-terminal domain-containing protein [Sphingomonas hankookensis]
MDAAQISRTGLDVEWQRLQTIALNLANMNSSGAPGTPGYRAMRLVSGPVQPFAAMLDRPAGVAVRGMAASVETRRVHEPGHPHADADGFVSYPAVDHAGEMTLLIRTARTYEANLTALSVAHQMYARALELGKSA